MLDTLHNPCRHCESWVKQSSFLFDLWIAPKLALLAWRWSKIYYLRREWLYMWGRKVDLLWMWERTSALFIRLVL